MHRRMAGEITTFDTRAISHEGVDKQKRYRQILSILAGHEMTAKEVAVEMMLRGFIPTSERNFTAPRLTELSKAGVVEPVGRRKCKYTGKTVAVYAVREQ